MATEVIVSNLAAASTINSTDLFVVYAFSGSTYTAKKLPAASFWYVAESRLNYGGVIGTTGYTFADVGNPATTVIGSFASSTVGFAPNGAEQVRISGGVVIGNAVIDQDPGEGCLLLGGAKLIITGIVGQTANPNVPGQLYHDEDGFVKVSLSA